MRLVSEKPYDDITVREIVERADVGRSTFYAHFDSKEDLLFSGFDEWLFALVEGGEPGIGASGPGEHAPGPGRPTSGEAGAAGSPTGPVLAVPGSFRFCAPLLGHIRGQRRFFRATIAMGPRSSVRRRTTDLIAELVRRELARARTGGTLPEDPRARAEAELRLEGRAYAVAGAFLGLAAWWMDNPRKLDAEGVAEVLEASVRPPEG